MYKLDLDSVEIVELDLTTMCNASCPLCFRQSIAFPEKFRDLQHWRPMKEIVKQLEGFKSLQKVYLIGQMSEPTTHPEFLDLVKYLKDEMHMRLKICSNGSLHNARWWSQLASMLVEGDDEIWFSLCGSTQELHSRYRRGTNLETILDNAAAVRQMCRVDCAKCIVFQYNCDDLLKTEAFKKIASQFSKVEWLDTTIELDQEKTCSNDFLPRPSLLDEHKKTMRLANFFLARGDIKIACQSQFDKQVQIDPFGNIFPCFTYFESYPLEHWNRDYSKILEGKCNCCKLCNSKLAGLVERKNLYTP